MRLAVPRFKQNPLMIRKYKASDRDALLEVWRKASALAHPFLSEDFMAREAEYMRNVFRADGERWVLEENGQPIGFIALIDNEIAGLFLHPSFHGKGLGRAMVDHAVSLKGPLRVEVLKENAIGRRFYESYGFVFAERYLHKDSGSWIDRMVMPSSPH